MNMEASVLHQVNTQNMFNKCQTFCVDIFTRACNTGAECPFNSIYDWVRDVK